MWKIGQVLKARGHDINIDACPKPPSGRGWYAGLEKVIPQILILKLWCIHPIEQFSLEG